MTAPPVESTDRSAAFSEAEVLPRFDSLLLALLAACSLSVVRIETAWHREATVVWIASEMMICFAGWVLMRRHTGLRLCAERYLVACLVTAITIPVAFTIMVRGLGYSSIPNEILILVCLQVTAIVLSMVSHVRRWSGLSVLLSAFLVLFSTTMTSHQMVFLIAGSYGVVGLWWLMVRYWERLQVGFAATHVEHCVPVRGAVIGASGLVVLGLAGIAGSTGTSTHVLRGFLPTSGGSQWSDPNSRAGVGDGDAMVAAKDNALSFGPVESDLFLESDMPSLYDTFNEAYGKPSKPKQQKAIALAAQEPNQNSQRLATTQRSGREFSTQRRQVQRNRKSLADREAAAMFYVVGKTPLHLGMESYDDFDGRTWAHRVGWQEETEPVIQSRFGKPWAVMRDRPSQVHRGTHCYGLKLINLKTNRIPSPSQLSELHIDRVDRADFYDWTRDGMIEMPGQEHIPQLTVMHMHAWKVNVPALRNRFDFTQDLSDEQWIKLEPYVQCSELHRAVANRWTAGVPRGWQQVEAVVHRLRYRFQHNPAATAPAECRDVVDHFLKTGSGPDYLFASAAVELLRSLGYPTRLVSGFYARPERFDHRAGQTSVLASDVHVWAEVCVDGHAWLTIEPTPGYRSPRESLTPQQWATACFWQCVRWCRRHWRVLVWVTWGMVLLALFRRECLDVSGWLVCRLCGLRSPQARLAWTIRLLEWRAWLAGRNRAPQKTITSWYRPLVSSAPDSQRAALASFFQWADRLLYSPNAIRRSNAREIYQACAAVVSTCERSFISRSLPTPSR